MAFCSRCGKELHTDNQFCPHCGKPVRVTANKNNAKPSARFFKTLPLFISAVIAFVSGFIGNFGYDNRWSGYAKSFMSASQRKEIQFTQNIMETVTVFSFILAVCLVICGIVLTAHEKGFLRINAKLSKICTFITLIAVAFCVTEIYIVFFTETCYF